MSCKQEDLSSDPGTVPNVVAMTVTVNPVLGDRNRDCWPCWHSSRFNERPCLKGVRDRG